MRNEHRHGCALAAIGSPVRMRHVFFWYHDPLALCIRQMSLELSDAEIRRLRDLDALLTHVGTIALSDVDCQASMDRMLFKFATSKLCHFR